LEPATLAVSGATPAADGWLIRGGTAAVALRSSGFALAVPSGSLAGACAVSRDAVSSTRQVIEGFSDETGRVKARAADLTSRQRETAS